MRSAALARSYRLRAIVAARAKTDKLAAALFPQLLPADLIPRAHTPPELCGPALTHTHVPSLIETSGCMPTDKTEPS